MNKKAFIRKLLKEYAAKFRIVDDISVSFPRTPDDDNDASANPPYLNIEEGVITSLERALVGEELWDRAKRIRAEGTYAAIDTSRGEYKKYHIDFYPALMSLPDEAFRDRAVETVVHELLHVVLFPLTSYTRSLEAGMRGG